MVTGAEKLFHNSQAIPPDRALPNAVAKQVGPLHNQGLRLEPAHRRCSEDAVAPKGFKTQAKGGRAKPGAVEMEGNSYTRPSDEEPGTPATPVKAASHRSSFITTLQPALRAPRTKPLLPVPPPPPRSRALSGSRQGTCW